jgi:hypothetical protein
MRLVQDRSWSRRGLSLLWGPELLAEIAKPGEVLSVREFYRLARNWPEDLPSGEGRTLVVAGVEGCVDLLPPVEAQDWLEGELRPRVLGFQDEYDSQAALVLWLPDGRRRVRMTPATESYIWACAGPWRNETIPLGQALWSGAEGDVGRILDPRENNQDSDGPGWVGLHHPRIS